MYAVAVIGAVSRLPTMILANYDPCFADYGCWVPNRLISTAWLVFAAFAVSRYQKALVHLLLGGFLTFAGFGFVGNESVFKNQSSGLFFLAVSLFFFVTVACIHEA